MRAFLLIAASTVLLLGGVRDSDAYYGYGPWCAVQSIGHGTVTENCSMQSFEQCRLEVIAGNRGFCQPNPRRAGPYGAGVKRVERRRRAYR
jgi:hypothetical protein